MISTKSNSIIFHGTGMIGEKVYIRLKKKYSIKFCIDKRERPDFHNLKVYKPDIVNKELAEKYTILVAVSKNYYAEIREEYEAKGLKEFEDFIFWEDLDKKLAVFYGNCHFHVLKKVLSENHDFASHYSIRHYHVFGFNVKGDLVPDSVKKHCDLLITQDVRKDNSSGVISAQELISMLPNSCKTLVIPNLYSVNLFYPQLEINVEHYYTNHIENIAVTDAAKVYDLKWESGFLECTDKYIHKVLIGEISEEAVVNMMLDKNLISHDSIRKMFSYELDKVIRREKYCDITISDYILENYKDKQLFYDPSHPTEYVLCEMARRILEKLELDISEEIKIEPILSDTELFVYECVREALGLHYVQKYIRVGKEHACLTSCAGMTREEFVRDVVVWSKEGQE